MSPTATKKAETPETEVIEPKAAFVAYEFGPEKELRLIQKPLSFFGKMEFFAIVGSAVEKALTADQTVGGLLSSTPKARGETLSADDFKDADDFLRVIARLVEFAPDLLKDLYVIALGVPKGKREYVKSIIELPEDEGGMSDDQGEMVLNTFIDQNWDVMVDFFKERVIPLVKKIAEKSSTVSLS